MSNTWWGRVQISSETMNHSEVYKWALRKARQHLLAKTPGFIQDDCHFFLAQERLEYGGRYYLIITNHPQPKTWLRENTLFEPDSVVDDPYELDWALEPGTPSTPDSEMG